jgi:BlaI family transcriptional regulator, penicillinase repressor
MPRNPSQQLTEVELQVLQVLWDQGPSPVRVIHAALADLRDTNYSTTVKMLSVMLDKGLIRRNETQRPHVYSAVVTRQRAQKRMLGHVIDQLYEGSATSLVLQALSSKKASPEELQQIRQMLDRIEGESK